MINFAIRYFLPDVQSILDDPLFRSFARIAGQTMRGWGVNSDALARRARRVEASAQSQNSAASRRREISLGYEGKWGANR